jgi:ABC-type multidrug transport system fused ATPase/permease subunit
MKNLGRSDANNNLETLLDMDKTALRKKNGVPAEPRKTMAGHGLEFKNLSYSVMKKQKKDGVWITKEAYLLNDISGQAIRGEVMAIMGPSGAGKSTFLDAIAGRIARGSLQGSVRIDGKPVGVIYYTSHSILKISDFVQQHGYI